MKKNKADSFLRALRCVLSWFLFCPPFWSPCQPHRPQTMAISGSPSPAHQGNTLMSWQGLMRRRRWDPREERQSPFTALSPHKSSEIENTTPPCDGGHKAMLSAVPNRAAQSSCEQAQLKYELNDSFSLPALRTKALAQGSNQRF